MTVLSRGANAPLVAVPVEVAGAGQGPVDLMVFHLRPVAPDVETLAIAVALDDAVPGSPIRQRA